MRSVFASIILVFAVAGPTNAQTSLADIKAKLAGKSSELAEVDAMLADSDRNNRIAAIELLLASGNPVFVQRAKEVGLFSSDLEMQAAALKAIFDGGGPFRILMDLTSAKEEQTGIRGWLANYGGVWDSEGKIGTYTFSTEPYDEEKKCWRFLDNSNCAIVLSGTTISLPEWIAGMGSLKLNSEGVLEGSFRNTNSSKFIPVPARIPLAE